MLQEIFLTNYLAVFHIGMWFQCFRKIQAQMSEN